MLRIHYGPMDGVIFNTAVYFKNVYQDAWLEDDFAKRMIAGVDKSKVVGPHLIESRVLGPIPPTGLSGGVKTLLLVNFMPEKVFNVSTCGDNCARWLLAIGRKQDVTINLRHLMNFGGRKFTIEIENTGQVVHSMKELVVPAGLLLSGDDPAEVLSHPLEIPAVVKTDDGFSLSCDPKCQSAAQDLQPQESCPSRYCRQLPLNKGKGAGMGMDNLRTTEHARAAAAANTRLRDMSGKKILPIGNSSFDSVVRERVYIDKSLLISDILESGYTATLFCRPRRFGKSLNLSMLKSFFEIPTDGQSRRELFEPLDIWNAAEGAYRSEQGAYPVVRLSLGGAKGLDWPAVRSALAGIVAQEYARHDYLFVQDSPLSMADATYARKIIDGLASEGELRDSLVRLETMLFSYHGRRVVLLIDEYDAPVMSGFTNGFYPEVVAFLKGLLTPALKDNDYLKLACLTGVQRISKESIFSDLNNLSVDTELSRRFDERFGFTESEVEAIAAYLGREGAMDDARRWYDGYRFGSADVYNPWSVLNFFQNDCAPDVYWANTSSNDVLGSLVRGASDRQLAQLFELLEPGGSISMNLDLGVVFPDVGVRGDALWSMLYLGGYLTTDDVQMPNDYLSLRRLRVPNLEVSHILRKEVVDRFSAVAGGRSLLSDFQRGLANGDVRVVLAALRGILDSSASYYDLRSENSYHMLLLGLCFGMPGYGNPRSNREAGDGCPDIQLVPETRNDGHPLVTIELKFVEAEEGSDHESALESAAEAAIQQIAEKGYDRQGQTECAGCVRWGIAFSGKQVAAQAQVA